MPIHSFERPAGRIVEIEIESEALKNNLLGDPARRTVAVYLPPEYEAETQRRFPLFVDLAAFTSSGPARLGWKAFQESVPQRLDRLVDEGRMGPVVAAFPDCFTALGGNQYINSAVLGHWEDFLIDEMLPALTSELRLKPGRGQRALFGKSSGGYGALVHGLRHADAWNAVACHSGDMAFDWAYRPDFPVVLDVLARHDRSVSAFMAHIRAAPKVQADEMHALMMLAMAATYDPDPDAPWGVRLPVDPETCVLDPERWAAWLAHDPVYLVEREDCRDNLRRLAGVYIDCGWKDPFRLHYGARQLVAGLKEAGIDHTYEEFDDNHSGIDYRLDVSLPFLYHALENA